MTGGSVEVAFGLGSNVGRKSENIARALSVLQVAGIARDLACSALYRTPPWGPIAQDWYVNACAVGTTDLAPQDLLRRIKSAEVALGRVETERWGPRVIDIDILYYDDVAMRVPQLTLPHPEMMNRAFVLVPLAELRPDRVVGGRTILEAAKTVNRDGVEQM